MRDGSMSPPINCLPSELGSLKFITIFCPNSDYLQLAKPWGQNSFCSNENNKSWGVIEDIFTSPQSFKHALIFDDFVYFLKIPTGSVQTFPTMILVYTTRGLGTNSNLSLMPHPCVLF